MLRVNDDEDDDDDEEGDFMGGMSAGSSAPSSPESTQAVLESGNVRPTIPPAAGRGSQQQQHQQHRTSASGAAGTLLTATPVSGSGDLQGLTKEQLTVAYAVVLARRMNMEVCTCMLKHRCKVCLNCVTDHCLCNMLKEHQQMRQQQPTANLASPAAAPPPASEQTQHPPPQQARPGSQPCFIEELARLLVRPTNNANQDHLSSICSFCHQHLAASALASNKAVSVKCENCSIAYHTQCLHINPDALPDGPWYCRGCFPQADYIFYPPIKPAPPTAIERARIMQIVNGEAVRLSEEAKLAFVEDYVKRFNPGNGVRLFIAPKQRT
eukprot:TRINITY_DN2103_c0_g2_i1.p1 TRINITY_DN2103_c0_g2~~TRINITY_DN2103_c0_g2_i1.p1  ORF type:complete len:325 (-),score=50.69 TRINITY_DN2103_c0_g2_i1:89-1063(-)